jgi:phosphatidylglycerophosphate synthase
VAANTVVGLAGAWAIWRGDLVVGALLLQLKTLLDNADGQLARAAGRTSTFGRYLDTEADLVVNIAVLTALGHVTGQPVPAAVALVALTAVLSIDFNVEALYREVRGEQFRPAPDRAAAGAATRALTAVYDVVFAPQDRAVRLLAERRHQRVLSGISDPASRERVTIAYPDGATVGALVNLGLSTQLAVLGVLLVAGVPGWYLWFAVGCAAFVAALWMRRDRLARMAART